MTKDALILIDIQKAFQDAAWGQANDLHAYKNMLKILHHFRDKGKTVIHIKHISDNPKSLFKIKETQDFQEGFQPLKNEVVFEKRVNSAFIGTNLESYLLENDIKNLYIIGLTLPHCVSTTTRMAANLGFDATVFSDATISFPLEAIDGSMIDAKAVHYHNLASLNQEFAAITDTKTFLNL